MSGVYSKARERIAAMDALAWSVSASRTVANAEKTRRNQYERKPERKAYKSAYEGKGGPGHERMLERGRRYRDRHREEYRERHRKYHEEHREQDNERVRQWRKMKKILALATILTTCGDSARHCDT